MVRSSSRSSGDDKKVQYKGVRMRSWGSWVSEIRAPRQKTRIWLGSYSTPEAAARAYDAALLCLKGSSASLNFPLPLGFHADVPSAAADHQLTTKSIQRLAAAAAASATTTTSTITTASTPPSPSTASPVMSSEDTASSCTEWSAPALEEYCIDSWLVDRAGSPAKYMEMMMLGAFLDPQPLQQVEEEEECFDEVGDIRLWSFC
ncbi:putative ethylene-responsive transcription factor ERF014 [Iris pallida]|uniref:Ethylene-responsive transcription factor ERF014 n=1 Tax=Iris pallida TaxID=29817 RepID=A0AAX6EPB3_IRIPA|nr:putative ethylene-responsive transcription factor ERF014 [Iris pallida]